MKYGEREVVGSRVPRDRSGDEATCGDGGCVATDGGHAGRVTLPVRKRLDHRGPLLIDVVGAWYFITLCAEGHRPWVGSRVPRPRGDGAAMDFDSIAKAILNAARWYHEHGKWRLALFLVMPDHLHFIVHFPAGCDTGHAGRVTLPGVATDGGHAGRVTLPMVAVIQRFKAYLTRTFGLRCQRDFFETRLRDDAHYDEKFRYVCNNPVRKGLVAVAREWPHVIAFDRCSGKERPHCGRMCDVTMIAPRKPGDEMTTEARRGGGHAGRVTLPGREIVEKACEKPRA